MVLNKKHFHHGHVPRITTNSCMLRLLVIYSHICLGIYLEVSNISLGYQLFFWNGFQSPCIVNCQFCPQFCQCPVQLQLQILIWKGYSSLWSLEGMIQTNKISVFHVMYLYWKVFELHIFQVLETNSTFHGKNRATPLQRHKSVCWQMVVKRKNAFWKHVKRFWPQSVTVQ